MARADDVLGRLATFDGRERTLELLDGGLTNRNYRVTLQSGPRFVARFSDPKTTLLGIDRQGEYTNARLAAGAGVGPSVAEFAPDDGVLVVEWITAKTFTDADLDDDDQLSRIAVICRRLHAAPRFAGDFDMFDVQRRYLETVQRRGFRLPPGYLELSPQIQGLERVLRLNSPPTVPCHNDLLAANILDDGARLWLIDYEYSGNNDPCFELGNICSEANLSVARLEHLVSAYYGRPAPMPTARARLFGTVAKYGWTLWAAIQDAVSEVDFDFWDWGMAKYERVRAELAAPDLDDLLSTAASADHHHVPQPPAPTRTHEGAEPWPTPST